MTDYKPKLIIFDLDKTLACCNVSFAFGSFLYKKGLLSLWRMLYLVCAYFAQKIGISSLDRLHHTAFSLFFYEQKKEVIEACVQEFLQKMGKELFRLPLVEVLEQAKREGIVVWIQSSSPDFLVQPIARRFGVSLVTASRYGVDETGAFCHVIEVINGVKKCQHLNDYAEKEKLSLQEVVAYSDSRFDLPLLQSVGHPIVVCPDRILKSIAHKHSWHVLAL